MPPESRLIETLKNILEAGSRPHELDAHPWAQSLVALEAAPHAADAPEMSPGQRLKAKATISKSARARFFFTPGIIAGGPAMTSGFPPAARPRGGPGPGGPGATARVCPDCV